jgi:hypothetical protein
MITTTHAILNATLLGHKDKPTYHLPLILGSILPDVPMFVYAALMALGRIHWYKLGKAGFGEYQYRALWVDWAHSLPLAIAGLLICLAFKKKWGAYLFAAMGLHDLEDLPLHAEYAHRHFLPFSNWRFFSPISYSDPKHFGALIAPLEWFLVLGCSYILWRRGIPKSAQLFLIFLGIFQGLWLLYYYGGVHWRGF